MMDSIWTDEYHGQRYTYHSALRPIGPSMLPAECTVVLTMGQDDRTIVTAQPLPTTYINQLSLVEVCDECGERIPDDDAVWHYHPGVVIGGGADK
jgi:hypothetical protein